MDPTSAAVTHIVHRGFRFKLYPTAEQETAFRQFAGVCRLVYNLALEQRRDHWRSYRRATGKSISYGSQAAELTKLRTEYDWIAACPQAAQQQALRDLDAAYGRFFKGRAGYPSLRKRGLNDGFRFPAKECGKVQALNAKWACIRLPKVGLVKLRLTRMMYGEVRNITVSHDALGWHISFACEIEHEPPANALAAVGIDRGVAHTLTLSTGEHMDVPVAQLERLEQRHRRAQRVVARRRKGSRRRLQAVRQAARIKARQARIRRDWHHRAALQIAERFGTVVLEDLKVANMTATAKGTTEDPGRNVRAKSGLNRSIMNQGWHAFETILAYKLEERGGHLLKVNPAYTSQTCSSCGCIDARSRKSQAVFECVGCGHSQHADSNAAKNILIAGVGRSAAEHVVAAHGGSGCGAGEVRTHREAA